MDTNTKEGRSFSLKHTPPPDELSAKRVGVDAIERKRRIDDVQDQIVNIDKRIGFKYKRVEAAVQSKSFKVCVKYLQKFLSLNQNVMS